MQGGVRIVVGLSAALALGLAAAGCSGDSDSVVVGGATAAATSGTTTSTGPAQQAQVVTPQTTFAMPPLGYLGVVGMTPGDFERNVPTEIPEIHLRFSEPVAAADVVANVVLDAGRGPLAGTWVSGADPALHTFRLARPLPAASHVVVRIDALSAQGSGHPLHQPFRAAFATRDLPRSPLRAGAFAVDITPPVGVPLGGYGSNKRRNALFPFLPGADNDPSNFHVLFKPSTAKRDPLRVKFLVLDDGVNKVAIASIDAIGCSNQLFDDVAPLIENAIGVRPDQLLVHGTHTHHGAGCIAHDRIYWHIAMDYFDARVYDPIKAAVVAAAIQANASLQPASLGATTVFEDRIGENRRGHPGRYGKDLHVVRVADPQGAAIATLFNLPVHPSALAVDDLRYSADLAGEAERLIESRVGGVGLFVNECEGDVAAKTPGGRSEAHMVNLGQTLGQRVLAELPNIPTTRDVPLDTISIVEDMGAPFTFINCASPSFQTDDVCQFFQQVSLQPALPIPTGSLHSRAFRFSALRLGDQATVATIPGEAITNVGKPIKDGLSAQGAQRAVIFGLTNGHMAYITDATEYDEGGYEASSTLFGRDTGERVIRHALFGASRLIR